MSASAKKERVWELDALRGLCILCVIVVHFIFDLQTFLGLPLRLPGVYRFIQDNGGVLFILLSGICATLGRRSFRRGLIVFACGMLITAVTLTMVHLGLAGRAIAIHFGVLHLLGTAMMLYPLLRRLPAGALALLGAAIVLAGYALLARRYDVEFLFILGIRSPHYAAGDYFPLLPHLGWFCLGIVLGRTLYRDKRTRFPRAPAQAAPVRFLRACGRQSLLIYLAHQPLLYGLVLLLSHFTGGAT